MDATAQTEKHSPLQQAGHDESLGDRLSIALPEKIKALRQFLVWKYVSDPKDPAKKPLKVPYYTNGKKRFGTQGSPEDRAQLATFADALHTLECGGYSGLGLAMLPEAGLVGIDLDDCIRDGVIDPKLASLTDGTYSEISPSGKGVRGFNLGAYPDRKHLDARVEVFHSKGFLTLTGDRLNGNEIIPLAEGVKARLDALFSDKKAGKSRAGCLDHAKQTDPIYRRLSELGLILKDLGGGRIGITCPFESDHTSGSGDSSTAYFLPFTNGYKTGHFHCLHAHCTERPQEDFLAKIGIESIRESEAWPELQPLVSKIDPLPYPTDALPDTIRRAVEEVQAFVKAPVPLVASSALSAVSVVAQAYVDIERAKKLDGPSNLYHLSIAPSGERKSTLDVSFLKAIRNYEAEQMELAKPILKAHRADKSAWDSKRAGILDAIKQAAKCGKETAGLESDLHRLQDREPIPPRIPRLLRGDETPESLAWKLAKEWPAGGVSSAEAGAIFGAHGMGADSIMRYLALLNILWDGGVLSIGRRSTESFTLRGARLTLGLQIQERTLREFCSKSNGLGRGIGFFARFLVSWPESNMGHRSFTEAPESWPALSAFEARLSEIIHIPVPIDENGGLIPTMLTLAPEAKTAWVAFHDAIESELRTGGELYDVQDVASKAADNAARLAALFHTFSHGPSGAVGLDSFEGAARIVAWHLNESRRFFGEIALPDELSSVTQLDEWLLTYCRQNRTLKVSTREVQQFGPGPLRNKVPMTAALAELEDLGRARVVRDGKRKIVQLNPALLEGGGK